jgi:2-methylcitrate dehydratase PrpD
MSNSVDGPTRRLASIAWELSWDKIPANVVSKAKDLLLDYIGCLVSSSGEDMAKVLLEVASTEGRCVGGPGATIVGSRLSYTTEWAAFVNGANAHLAELDDTHRGTAAHVGLGVWATALAVAERYRCSGSELLTAAITGYEVALRVASSVMPSHYLRGWNPSGTATMFGCAATAGKLLGLEEEKICHALGLAGVMAAGNRAHLTERVMTKDFNNGHAARCGVTAALLARAGFTASTDEFENALGFWNLYGGDTVHPEELVRGLNVVWRILEVGQKPYPSCRFIHSSIEAVLDLREIAGARASEVESIVSRMSAAGKYIVDDARPWLPGKGTMGPRFSAQFNIAVAWVLGQEGLMDIYDPAAADRYLQRDDVRDLMSRVRIDGDSGIDKDMNDLWRCVLAVRLRDGDTQERRVSFPLGEPENPMDAEMLERRFRRMTQLHGWDGAAADELVEGARSVETDGGLRRILRLLRSGASGVGGARSPAGRKGRASAKTGLSGL